MKKISKVMSVILALVLTLSVFTLNVSAAVAVPEIKLMPNRAAAQIGDVVTIAVTVPANSRLCSLSLDLIYDEADFEFVDAVENGVFDVEALNPTFSNHSIRYAGTTSGYISDEVSTVFAARFKILDNCRDIYAVINEAYVIDGNGKQVNVTMDANILSNPVVIHQSGDENVILEPTCYETGFKTYNCPCGAFVEENTPAKGHTYSAGVCVDCGAIAPEEVVKVYIQEPSATTIRSEDGIVLHAIVQGNMNGKTIEWTASDNKCFDTDVSGNDITIISKKKGTTVFTVTIYDIDGTAVSSASIEMESKAGFFERIGGFFRKLFRTNVIYAY